MNASIKERLCTLEEGLSKVRKTKEPMTFSNLQTIEEVEVIRQAKREHHPVFARFSGKAFINLDDDRLYRALEEGVIDALEEDTELLTPFIEEAKEDFRLAQNISCLVKQFYTEHLLKF
ncbi:hypothetical protein [Candidatus Neptunochlamydia vexilliferae]|uniref:hypothetical protein n=1 Tax=Candidatus Neptunichlamydia vexilliferae TaxID=1651774 RepID=UPI001E500DA5|nr:hypothetical protein [Candidatus Neptunochlamydia vexilliferae]